MNFVRSKRYRETRMAMGSRDVRLEDILGLNSAWYADILLILSA